MIISYSNKFIWVKTKKCATSSIEISLDDICEDGDVYSEISSLKKVKSKAPFDKMIKVRKKKQD